MSDNLSSLSMQSSLNINLNSPSPMQVDPNKPLVGQAVVRGPYTNTGSKDIGPDPKQYSP